MREASRRPLYLCNCIRLSSRTSIFEKLTLFVRDRSKAIRTYELNSANVCNFLTILKQFFHCSILEWYSFPWYFVLVFFFYNFSIFWYSSMHCLSLCLPWRSIFFGKLIGLIALTLRNLLIRMIGWLDWRSFVNFGLFYKELSTKTVVSNT